MRKLIKNDYALSVFSKVFSMVIGLLTSAFLTRFLGVTNKGEYSFINQAVSVSALVLNLGIYQSYSYYYRQRGDSIFQDYTSIFIVQFFAYAVIGSIVVAFSGSWQLSVIAMMIPFQVLRLQMDNIMLVQNVKIRLITNMAHSVLLMLCYLFLYLLVPSAIFPVAIVIIVLDVVVSGSYFVTSRIKINIKRFSMERLSEVVRFGFLPMLSALLVTLNYSVDIFFLKKIGTAADLSMYAVAAGIMNYVWIVPDAFKDIIFSRVARDDKDSSVAMSTRFSLIFLMIVAIGFLLLGRLFISIMYGTEFMDAYGVTLVLFLGVFSMVFFKIFGIVLIAQGRRQAHFVILLISVILNVVLNWIFIPIYGMYGAAFASVASYNLCGILFLLYFSKISKIKVRDLLIPSRADIEIIKNSLKERQK